MLHSGSAPYFAPRQPERYRTALTTWWTAALFARTQHPCQLCRLHRVSGTSGSLGMGSSPRSATLTEPHACIAQRWADVSGQPFSATDERKPIFLRRCTMSALQRLLQVWGERSAVTLDLVRPGELPRVQNSKPICAPGKEQSVEAASRHGTMTQPLVVRSAPHQASRVRTECSSGEQPSHPSYGLRPQHPAPSPRTITARDVQFLGQRITASTRRRFLRSASSSVQQRCCTTRHCRTCGLPPL